MKAAVKPVQGQPHFNYLLIIDFEATCQEHNPSGFKYEIIEFPIILIDTYEQRVVSALKKKEEKNRSYNDTAVFC